MIIDRYTELALLGEGGGGGGDEVCAEGKIIL